MKKTASVLIIILILAITIVIMTQPEEPVNDCTVKNTDLSRLCLSYIPKYYNADFLTYMGHTKARIYRWLDKSGIKLGNQQIKYLSDYSYLEDAVNCHLTASGDARLNMTMTPTEFDAAYKMVTLENGANK